MLPIASVVGIGLIALGMALTPGPNMVYLASRSISQGRRAGLVSLGGVALGFVFYLGASAAGLSALFAAVPAAYTTVKLVGAVYLAYLAWNMLRPGGRSPFEARELDAHSPFRLFAMGLVTNILNPKIALMYAALVPQFVHPENGPVLGQFLQLGLVQITVAVAINGAIVLAASSVSEYLRHHPRVMAAQRLVTGALLSAFAVKVAAT
ncbi:LysE family translocator [Rhodococcus globerulus]|uniref:LysE family translocator n=1 Tax=Rhodococcus globerulus TaxID=33008 RepID=A0ABU4BZI4_RHOGO|nr:LysE family translocator [Rhodococcus globerulus]MDV6269662.1 LysE family translocator [Rhodococcus globerulus]